MFNLSGKNILVTGASSGIGRSCAILLSEVGADVTLAGRSRERLQRTLEMMSHGNHSILSQDITIFQEIEKFVQRGVEENGPFDGFIHSAGLEKTVPLRKTSIDHYNQLFNINVLAGLEIAKYISKKNFHNEQASFVFIASVMGFLGQAGKVGYCASKGALVTATRAMALELAAKKIRVNCISPALVNTELTQKMLDVLGEEQMGKIDAMHPLGVGDPVDVANAALFLLSDKARWITGSNLVVDGGYSCQ